MEQEKIVLLSKKDLVITWFNCGGGGGGQHKNRHNNCCRMVHPESGASAVGTSERSASQNQKEAFRALTKTPKFKVWIAKRLLEIRTGETIEQKVERQMHPRNLRVEGILDGQWVELVD